MEQTEKDIQILEDEKSDSESITVSEPTESTQSLSSIKNANELTKKNINQIMKQDKKSNLRRIFFEQKNEKYNYVLFEPIGVEEKSEKTKFVRTLLIIQLK